MESTSSFDQKLQQILDISTEPKKRKRYGHAEMNSTTGRELLDTLNIQLVAAPTVPITSPASMKQSVTPFAWETIRTSTGEDRDIKLTEERNRKAFRTYVETNISQVLAEKKLCLFDIERGQNILSVRVPGHEIDLSGSADLLVQSDIVHQSLSFLNELPDVKMSIEVKQNIVAGAEYQAISGLIALDLLASDPVVALLTDLNTHWQFFWVSDNHGDQITVHHALIEDPDAAFHTIRALLQQQPRVGVEFLLPCLTAPVKRRKLDTMLPAEEAISVRGALERYFDVANELGPDVELARETAARLVRSIPAFRRIA